ncbi:hypothetical protein LR48_Vigan09g085100 [Vigna angularis]|uniref:Uncharacterized protein n=1 Tax=Phaseolus angularis TaxID=3914 RepID=A0A0L9VB97_PHAAN|nr:hypothetical protein LR48_Vigan09g085100 [Vigna angularis]
MDALSKEDKNIMLHSIDKKGRLVLNQTILLLKKIKCMTPPQCQILLPVNFSKLDAPTACCCTKVCCTKVCCTKVPRAPLSSPFLLLLQSEISVDNQSSAVGFSLTCCCYCVFAVGCQEL